MSQVEKGEHRRSHVYERCEVHWWCCNAAAAVVPLLYCAGAFELQRRCELELSLDVFRMAHPHNTPTRTRKSTVRGCHKNEYLELRLLLLCRDCHSVKSLRCDTGTQQQRTAYHKTKRAIKKAEWHLLLETVVFRLIPAPVGSYNDTHTHAR